ncbi:MAG: hypothetical protein HY326_06630 [Chloroflexi bacterium]|nr:hypothetical protein [Chloroflexota bacterium]
MSIKKLLVLFVAALLLAIAVPAVATASQWYCIGDPVVPINNQITDVDVRFDVSALLAANLDGRPVVVKIYAPSNNYNVIINASPFPIRAEYIYTPGDTVRFEATGPDYRGYGAYRIQLNVLVPLKLVNEVSDIDQAQSPHVSMELPYSLWK